MNDPIKSRIQELVPETEAQADLHYALEALVMMYEQYCGDYGHQFMSAGENACAVLEYFDLFSPDEAGRGKVKFPRNYTSPITLAVVLRAIAKANAHVATEFREVFTDVVGRWNLAKDNYDDQTKETQAFIGRLLGVKE